MEQPPDTSIAPETQWERRPHPAIPDHTLLKRIGRGSYGEVWLARNIMGEYRAIKVVYRDSFREDRPYQRELLGIRKFEPVSRSHEGFIDILHIGINEEAGYFYYVMEAADDKVFGREIRSETYSPKSLGKGASLRGLLTLDECIRLGLALSLALSELHKRGLVHRDVKPSNIIFVNGVPKLADIGLVAELSEARSYVGTEGFIAPEGPGSPQADIYSLGKTLYEISTGRDRHDFPVMPEMLDSNPHLDQFLELNEVMLQACKSDLKVRYQSAADMHADLLIVAAGRSVIRLKILERRLARVKRVAGISMVVALVLAGVLYQGYRDWKVAVESRERQVGGNIAYGNRAMESGDLLGSLPFFANAMKLDSQDLDAIATHRLRIGSVLAQSPKLSRVWSEGIEVNNAEFTPDGAGVLVAELHGNLTVYDLASGAVCSRSSEDSSGLWSAGFSPDGRLVVTANRNNFASVLASSNLAVICRLPHPDQVDSSRFSPDGSRIVTACRDGIARVWAVRSQKLEFSFRHSQKILFADFSPDGLSIATASVDNTACIWDTKKGKRLTLDHPSWVNYIAYSPDGNRVVTACADHKARVWDSRTGLRVMPDLIHGDGVSSAEFSPDGRMILTASLDGNLRLWFAASLQPVVPIPIIRTGERLIHAHFSRDGRQIVTSGADGTVRVWDLASTAISPHPMPYATSADGNRSILVTNGTVEIRDVASGNPVSHPIHAGARVDRMVMNRDGQKIAVVKSSETEPGSQVQVLDVITGTSIGPPLMLSNDLPGLVLSSSGAYLISLTRTVAQLWDVRGGINLSKLSSNDGDFAAAIFNSTDTQFAMLSGNRIEVRSTLSGQLCFAPLEFTQQVEAAEFSRDGSRIAGCCIDPYFTKCYAQVWSAKDGRSVGQKLTHGDGVCSASFSLDGTRIVTASEDFTATVWDASTGARLIAPVQHTDKVRSASFSSDGKWFATASFDGIARVWNSETGDPLTPPLRHFSNLTNAVFLEHRNLVTYDTNGNYYLWPLAVDDCPIGDLVVLSRLLSGTTETRFGALNSQSSESLETTWKRLRQEYPSTFAVTEEEIERWHDLQAQECDADKEWSAEAFHLRCLLRLRPNDERIIHRLATVSGFPSPLKSPVPAIP